MAWACCLAHAHKPANATAAQPPKWHENFETRLKKLFKARILIEKTGFDSFIIVNLIRNQHGRSEIRQFTWNCKQLKSNLKPHLNRFLFRLMINRTCMRPVTCPRPIKTPAMRFVCIRNDSFDNISHVMFSFSALFVYFVLFKGRRWPVIRLLQALGVNPSAMNFLI